MATEISQDNAVLDRIIGERRSHRKFAATVPSREQIESIIHAGLHAPYAAAAIGSSADYFRRFFVVRKESKAMQALIPLAFAESVAMAAALEKEVSRNAALREQSAAFAGRLAMIRELGMVPGIGTAPIYIVAAEKKGFPPVEQQSQFAVIENMWLKATALGLGFQVVSITAQMADNEPFCRVLGIDPGKWALMGCAVGYPAGHLSPSIRPNAGEVTTWLA